MAAWLRFAIVVCLCVSSLNDAIADYDLAAETPSGIPYAHGYAYLSELKYPPGFSHFDYVNPDAPKGGALRLGEQGNWDNFVAWATKGRTVLGVAFWESYYSHIYDGLLEEARDEPASRYGLLAEGVYYADGGDWVAFKLRDGAYWHDGEPVTVDDLLFSFEVYQTHAAPTISQPFSAFTDAQVIGPNEVRYLIDEAFHGDPVLPYRIGGVPVLPKHYWAGRDPSKTSVEPPLGSGPYRVKDFKIGRWIEYERVEDYWAADLPVNRGRYNFDIIKYDYFRDDQVRHEAVKSHVSDLREEEVPGRWFRSYEIPAKEAGYFRQEAKKVSLPSGLWWPIFWNLRQERFQDIRIREALWLVRDPAWGNEAVQRGFWSLARSYFHNSRMASSGLPSDDELALLEPMRELVPPRVFTEEFAPPPGAGEGFNRGNIIRAIELFDAAGWEIRDNVMVNKVTGEPFELQLVAVSTALGFSWIAYKRVLERLGIHATIVAPEVSNWLYRMRSGDFDGGAIWFLPNNTPTVLLQNNFSSAAAEQAYSYNWPHMKDPAVDQLIDAVNRASNEREFLAAIHALDRVLLWNFYFMPGTSRSSHGLVWWDKFGYKETEPLLRIGYRDTWWWDEAKAAKVRDYLGRTGR